MALGLEKTVAESRSKAGKKKGCSGEKGDIA
jgi:hypothetical protein